MALDFPANPTDGQAYGSYVFDGTAGVWKSREESAAVTVVSPTAPLSANPGDLWLNSNNNILFAYYSDDTSSQWVEVVTSNMFDISGKANIESPTFSGTVTLPSTTSIGNVSSTEIGYVDGVTSAIQTQLNTKAAIAGQAFTGTVTSPNIGANVASPTYRVETNGRVKLRSDGAQSSGMWLTDNAGTETVFMGQTGTASSDPVGFYHSGAWRIQTNATLTTWENDTDFIRWRGRFDRAWDNYPSITIYNTTDKGPQGEFRIHGYPGSNGGDFSIVTRCDGGFATGSDARRKSNVEEISNALQRINAISGKTFNIINSDGDIETELSSEQTGKKFGFIAQDVAGIIPEAVKYYPEADTPNETGYASAYSIDYGSIVPLLLQGINELSQKVKALEERLNGS